MIDLRSDVCSVPTDAMWEAMREAELGWAIFGEDALASTRSVSASPRCSGRPAATLAADLRHGEPRGDAHVLHAGRAGRARGRVARALVGVDGDHRDRAARAACRCGRRTGAWIRPTVEELVAESHAALLILENTHTRAGGTTLSVELTEALGAAAKRHDCRVHIDGARLSTLPSRWVSRSADLAAPANSVVISLNKALSAPFGAVLAGSEAVVERAG